jgi:SAM-dependent methyltransferase
MTAVPSYYDDVEFAAQYDCLWGDHTADLPMYEQFARRSDGPSLELGAGTGRVALHLARAGLDVVALDGAQAMLDRLRSRIEPSFATRIRIVEADMRSFDLDEKFELVFCAANTFMHLLTHDDQLASLGCVARHLADGGIFVVEMRTPRAVDWTVARAPLELRTVRELDGDRIVQMQSLTASAAAQTTTTTYIIDRVSADGGVRRSLYDVTLRYTGLAEYGLLLQQAGMRVAQTYSDADLSPFDDGSDSMIVVAGQA